MMELAVPDQEDGTRLDRFLRRACPHLPQSAIEKNLRNGRIRLDGAKARSNSRLVSGQSVSLPDWLLAGPDKPVASASKPGNKPPAADEIAAARKALNAMLLAQTDDWMVLDKPAGLATQGGSGIGKNLDAMLMTAYGPDRPLLVHRLDRDTSGLILLARDRAAARQLGIQIKARALDKVYLAISLADPGRAGVITAPLVKSGAAGFEKMQVADNGQAAETRFVRLGQAGRFCLLALQPVTGRTHQLRVHMAHHGAALLGDGKYAGAAAHPVADLPRQLHLHAGFLRLPDGTELAAPLPAHFLQSLDFLGLAGAIPDQRPDFKNCKRAIK